MKNFKREESTDKSKRGFVCGVGINDSYHKVRSTIDGKVVMCPIYSLWTGMIHRCYSDKRIKLRPKYAKVTVCEEWLLFSNFLEWADKNYIDGYQLDKDIKIKGNKVYGPDACLFVPLEVNSLLGDSGSKRGSYPMGVNLHKQSGKFEAKVKSSGKRKYIGLFKTAEEARAAYVVEKNKEILSKCEKYPSLSVYLMEHLL